MITEHVIVGTAILIFFVASRRIVANQVKQIVNTHIDSIRDEFNILNNRYNEVRSDLDKIKQHIQEEKEYYARSFEKLKVDFAKKKVEKQGDLDAYFEQKTKSLEMYLKQRQDEFQAQLSEYIQKSIYIALNELNVDSEATSKNIIERFINK